MADKANNKLLKKNRLHPINKHRFGYDFEILCKEYPQLSNFVFTNPHGNKTIDFSNPTAVKALNKALLLKYYCIREWEIPDGFLCPPIPGRADYIHHMADLLAASNDGKIPIGPKVKALDIGVGANCIYPLIGNSEYGWRFTGSDVNPVAVASAIQIVSKNQLEDQIEIRLQKDLNEIFKNIILENEAYDFTMCNPPFHASPEEATKGTKRKWKNLGHQKKNRLLNFGGQNTELWYEGGEIAFLEKMVTESAFFQMQCFWFSSLVSKESNLSRVYKTLKKTGASDVRTIAMAQGQKTSRIVAWTFLNQREQKEWSKKWLEYPI